MRLWDLYRLHDAAVTCLDVHPISPTSCHDILLLYILRFMSWLLASYFLFIPATNPFGGCCYQSGAIAMTATAIQRSRYLVISCPPILSVSHPCHFAILPVHRRSTVSDGTNSPGMCAHARQDTTRQDESRAGHLEYGPA